MLSISGAILRLSWFISNSYSKSEIARSPLTIALAPLLAGEIDEQRIKGFHLHIAEFCDLRLDEGDALLGAEERLLLAHRLVDHPDDHVSNTCAARLMMSRWPNVTGS